MAHVLTTEEERDAKRIAAARAREADRVQRMIHDPFNRQIGQDLQGLQQQIREKEVARAKAANQAQEEAEQARLMQARLEAMELERQQRGSDGNAALRAAWEQARQEKAAERERQQRQDKAATMRSGFKFAGEDPLRGERKRMQQIQMQRWSLQQQAEKRQQAEKQGREDDKYLKGLAALDEIARRSEADKQEEAKRVAAQVREENLMMARERRQMSSRERARALQGAGAQVASDSGGGHFLPSGGDFRGLTPEQKQRIQAENDALAAEARARKQREREDQAAYGAFLRRQANHVERVAIENEDAARQARQEHLEALKQQQMELEQKRRNEKRYQKDISYQDGFFGGFGKTSR